MKHCLCDISMPGKLLFNFEKSKNKILYLIPLQKKLAHYKSRTDFLKVSFACQSFIKSVA